MSRQLAWMRRVVIGTSVAAVLATSAAIWFATRASPSAETNRFVLNFEQNERLGSGIGVPFAFSPDGKTIAYAASRGGASSKLYVRRMDELTGRELVGTDNASNPTFSPDGRWIAFGVGNQLRKIGLSGGGVVPIASVSYSAVRGISWGRDGTLVLGDVRGNLLIVPEAGGDTVRFAPDSIARGELSQRWPLLLDDGQHVIYSSWTGGSLSTNNLWIASLADRKSRPLGVAGTMPLRMLGEDLVYVSPSGTLMSVAIDTDGMRTKGSPPTPAAEQVALDATAGWARASLSHEGSLMYQSALSGLVLTLVNIDTRAETSLLPDRRAYGFPRFSPDGRRVAMSITEATGTTDLWILDRNAGTLQRLTDADGTNDRPEWMPDGKRVLFRSSVGQGVELRWQAADRSSAPVSLQQSQRGVQLNEGVVSPNGEWLVFRVFGQNNPMDIWYRRLAGDTTTQNLLVGAAYETAARFSPDGKWLAYSSDESGPRQVYVTPFPGPGPRHQVSVDGGQEPVWSPDGKRLYYVREPQVMAASVTLAPMITVTERRIVLDGSYTFNYVHANYDVAPDGKHLLVLKRDVEAQAIVVRNWSSTLARRAAR